MVPTQNLVGLNPWCFVGICVREYLFRPQMFPKKKFDFRPGFT